MLNVVCRNQVWYFHRRVPTEFKAYDSRRFVRSSLKTRCKKEAIRLAGLENTKLIEYWKSLKATGQFEAHEAFVQANKRASLLGFQYLDKLELLSGTVEQLIQRVLFLADQKLNKHHVEALLGTVAEPQIMLADLFPKFLDLTKEEKIKKCERQYRRWKNPRLNAINSFINLIGNKAVQDVTRQDFLTYKNWWIDRISGEKKVKTGTANKSISQVKSIIETVCDNLNIKQEKQYLFSKLMFEDDYEPRLPYTSDFIVNTLLNDEKMAGLSDHFKKMIQVFAETGVHVDEQIGILPEDISIDHKIPHIRIVSRDKDKLKNKHRSRVMPLVGFALDAFKAYPKGFSHIVKNSDSASSAIGKFLRENNLQPSPRHSPYSLRHSFQDRLTNADCPDRIQTDLMGHAFKGRTKYGTGATLEHSFAWMKKIQLKKEEADK
ncbi:DUF6538 domain-containing protein [Mucilaginibacter calamicampi]|uniref:DUF6538 domain-containing protein n=1 Tax=Mucilaginibacter calamicampi TaxID=1302352 RepID=A0ABW2YZS3_9SPHI